MILLKIAYWSFYYNNIPDLAAGDYWKIYNCVTIEHHRMEIRQKIYNLWQEYNVRYKK